MYQKNSVFSITLQYLSVLHYIKFSYLLKITNNDKKRVSTCGFPLIETRFLLYKKFCKDLFARCDVNETILANLLQLSPAFIMQ